MSLPRDLESGSEILGSSGNWVHRSLAELGLGKEIGKSGPIGCRFRPEFVVDLGRIDDAEGGREESRGAGSEIGSGNHAACPTANMRC